LPSVPQPYSAYGRNRRRMRWICEWGTERVL
ncbi:uncharacterized protein METZ01_LOCUS444279, partial [marine metagenome]